MAVTRPFCLTARAGWMTVHLKTVTELTPQGRAIPVTVVPSMGGGLNPLLPFRPVPLLLART